MFYLLRGEKQEGPLEAADLKHMVRSGELSGGELCWREGWPEWRPLSSIAGLIPTAPATASPQADHSPAPAGFDERFAGGTPHPFHRDHSGMAITVLCLLLVASLVGNAVTGIMLWNAAADAGRDALKKGELLAALEETVNRSQDLRAPLEGGRVGAWITYDDERTGLPIPVTRANALLYPLKDVENELHAVVGQEGAAAAGTLIERLTSSLPSPFRENITDSNGFVTFDNIDEGPHILVALARKLSGGTEVDYMWVAECDVSDQPSMRLILSEENATKPDKPSVEIIGRGGL